MSRRRARARSSSDCALTDRLRSTVRSTDCRALRLRSYDCVRPFCGPSGSCGRFSGRSGSISGLEMTSFRAFWRSTGRFDEKTPTLTKHCPCAAKQGSGPPPSDAKSIENRFGRLSRTTVRKDRSEKASRARPGALFGRSGRPGSSPERPGRSPERPEGVPGRLRSVPGASRAPPGPPPIVPDRPEGLPDRFWLDFASVLAGFRPVFWSSVPSCFRLFVRLFVRSFVRSFAAVLVPSFVRRGSFLQRLPFCARTAKKKSVLQLRRHLEDAACTPPTV